MRNIVLLAFLQFLTPLHPKFPSWADKVHWREEYLHDQTVACSGFRNTRACSVQSITI